MTERSRNVPENRVYHALTNTHMTVDDLVLNLNDRPTNTSRSVIKKAVDVLVENNHIRAIKVPHPSLSTKYGYLIETYHYGPVTTTKKALFSFLKYFMKEESHVTVYEAREGKKGILVTDYFPSGLIHGNLLLER